MKDDGADRGAMRAITPWGKRPARRRTASFSTVAVPGLVLIWAAQARRLLFFVNAGCLEGFSWLGG